MSDEVHPGDANAKQKPWLQQKLTMSYPIGRNDISGLLSCHTYVDFQQPDAAARMKPSVGRYVAVETSNNPWPKWPLCGIHHAL